MARPRKEGTKVVRQLQRLDARNFAIVEIRTMEDGTVTSVPQSYHNTLSGLVTAALEENIKGETAKALLDSVTEAKNACMALIKDALSRGLLTEIVHDAPDSVDGVPVKRGRGRPKTRR